MASAPSDQPGVHCPNPDFGAGCLQNIAQPGCVDAVPAPGRPTARLPARIESARDVGSVRNNDASPAVTVPPPSSTDTVVYTDMVCGPGVAGLWVAHH